MAELPRLPRASRRTAVPTSELRDVRRLLLVSCTIQGVTLALFLLFLRAIQ